MKKYKWNLALVYVLCSVCCSCLAIRIRNQDESETSSGITASPTLIYRRRLNSGRNNPNLYPNSAPQPSKESKTDSLKYIRNESPVNSYEDYDSQKSTFAEPPPVPKKIIKTLRRQRTRVRNPQSSRRKNAHSPSPTKIRKSKGRRRKVKRPHKAKPRPVKSAEELMGAINNNSNNSENNSTNDNDDKNLALEIVSKDGKYALIDKFFTEQVEEAPGVISYAQSDDFRNDNQYTLGNVKQNDIWLSDGHLLVLKGGDLDASLQEHWSPIDNYQRGNRPPLKIALDSNNPPPFPVFVNETGPPVFLGPPPPFGLPYPPPGAFNETFDPSRLPPPGMVPLYPNGSIPEYFGPPPSALFGGGNNSIALYPGGHGAQNGSRPIFPPFPPPGSGYGNNSYPPPNIFPFPHPGFNNGSRPPVFLPPPPGFTGNISGGPPPYPLLPPLALNPNDNETDDPSIFLPPPYDFDYQDDNNTIVAPGPFAPGLVVPPPRNFYTVYNKTTKRPSTGISFFRRTQRPNAKKPRFPLTNPPDDSEEALRPLVTTPFPYSSNFKKRKESGKSNKGVFETTFESEKVENPAIVRQPLRPLLQDVTPTPLISNHVVKATIAPTKPTTPKQLSNYVYVRGQLKDLNGPQKEQEDYRVTTPQPPYDERGYPTRFVDDGVTSLVTPFGPRKTTPHPVKQYVTTAKFNPNYNGYTTKKTKPQQYHRQQYVGYNNQQQQFRPKTPSPRPHYTVSQQPHRVVYENNQVDEVNEYRPGTTFQENVVPVVNPTYYSRPRMPQSPKKQSIVQLESPKTYSRVPNTNHEAHQFNHAKSIPNYNYPTTSVFRPAFGPTSLGNQQPDEKPNVLYSGQVTQTGPIFNFRNPLYQQQQQQQPQLNGYYSPITQYYQPIEAIPQSQGNYYTKQHQQPQYFGTVNPVQQNALYQSKPTLQPYFSQHSQSHNGVQDVTNPYQSPFQFNSQAAPNLSLQQDGYLSYREPLSQYNTESEAVTSRAVFKAGPTKAPSPGGGKRKTVSPNNGSFYSFQRGGPGGFSYKIQLRR